MASSYSNLHPVDQILTGLVAEAVPSDNQLIADKALETISISERSGTLLLEETRNFMGAGAGLDLERAPGSGRAMIGGFDRSSQTFMAKIYSASDSIAMEDIFDSQYPGSEEARIAKKVARVLKLAREKRIADLLFNVSGATFNTSAAAAAFNTATAEPLSELFDLKDTVFSAAHGINPDTLIMGRACFRALAKNAEVRGFVGTLANGVASGNQILNDEAVLQVLRDVLGIPNIYVGQALQDTAVPGATSSESAIWDGTKLFMGILRGSDAVVQKSGNVKAMPIAAVNLQYNDMVAGQYDSLDKTRRYVWGEEVNTFHAVDGTLGHVLTGC
jgi:hypothetical protein